MTKGTENWYMLWYSDKSHQESAKDAVRRFIHKYGQHPSILLINKDVASEELTALEGFTYIVKADPYVPAGCLFVGEVPHYDMFEVQDETA